MANINMRSSVLAIVPEVTEGTVVDPSAATQFIALQDDMTITPNIESLDNAEVQASLAPSKPIQGSESPSASLSHYFRASGVVATAPGFKELLKCNFTETIAGSEHDTVSSSTTSLVKVDTGEGASYGRGHALLIKDATNGYRLRPVHSVSGNDLTLGFNVPVAPAAGVNLGRAVKYAPKETANTTVCLHHYLGNGGALQVMGGGRVTSMDISANAGELLNASYTVEGIKYHFNPIRITATNKYLDFEDDGGVKAAIVAEGYYKDPEELAVAVKDAADAVSSETFTVSYSSTTGKYSILCTGTLLELPWDTGTNTANSIGATLGYNVATDDTGTAATTGYTADNALSFVAGYTPDFDVADPYAVKYQEVMVGSATDYACFEAPTISVNVATPKADINSVCAQSGKSGSVITERTVEISLTAVLPQYNIAQWVNFRKNTEIRFQYSFGNKSGGNWVAGQCGLIYLASGVITSFEVQNENGVGFLSMTIRGFVADGLGEIYFNFC